MERCPKCGALLEVIECCGGGIYRCDACGEFYFYGELIESQKDSEEASLEVQEPPHQPEDLPPQSCKRQG